MQARRPIGAPALLRIDCDIHPAVPSTATLLRYLDPYWREALTTRGMDKTILNSAAYPPSAPISVRADWRPETGRAGTSFDRLQAQVFDQLGSSYAICNCLYGLNALHSEDMAAVLCTALNRWIADEWLARDHRLHASIVVPIEAPDLAVKEIERWADNPRFVQVLLLSMGEMPLGRRFYWPIYEAAERHGLVIGIHPGSTGRQPLTPAGWPSYLLEDYVNQAQAFETQILSFVAEGVFAKFPKLKLVCLEAGFMWFPAFIWRANKTWRGVRAELPWVKRAPAEIVRDHVRFTLQPFDAPPTAEDLAAVFDQMGSDRLVLYSSDYPHWQFDGDDPLPEMIPESMMTRICRDNPLETYGRLASALAEKELVQ
jgi:predicted TIM-barrel fold metal-dependent hydrolase